jgi:catechol 2,3-dioxygenase-like lactoylglutathione lyase family enzyme
MTEHGSDIDRTEEWAALKARYLRPRYAEVLGGLHHIAISVSREQWDRLVGKLQAAGVGTHIVNGESAYFSGPDGERLELLTFPLNDMYGTVVN